MTHDLQNRRHRNGAVHFALMMASIGIVSAGTALITSGNDDDGAKPTKEQLQRVRTIVLGGDPLRDGGSTLTTHSIEMSIIDGVRTVTLDGKPVDDSRIIERDGRLIVVDDKGEEVAALSTWTEDPGDHPMHLISIDVNETLPLGMSPDILDLLRNGLLTVEADVQVEPPAVMIGVNIADPHPALNHHLGLVPGTTAMFSFVYDDLAADRAGIETFDIVTAINGESPADPRTLRAFLRERTPGETVSFAVIHRGQPQECTLVLQPFDADQLVQQNTLEHVFTIGPGQARFSEMRIPSPLGPNVFIPRDADIELLLGSVDTEMLTSLWT